MPLPDHAANPQLARIVDERAFARLVNDAVTELIGVAIAGQSGQRREARRRIRLLRCQVDALEELLWPRRGGKV
jgi:hypothetical protein